MRHPSPSTWMLSFPLSAPLYPQFSQVPWGNHTRRKAEPQVKRNNLAEEEENRGNVDQLGASFILALKIHKKPTSHLSPLLHPTLIRGGGCWHSSCLQHFRALRVYHPIQALVVPQNFRVRKSKDPETSDTGHKEVQSQDSCQASWAELTKRNLPYQQATSNQIYRHIYSL